jgi:hypothetical protein
MIPSFAWSRAGSLTDLITPSVQINIRAGNLPEADETRRRHLKVPINEL